MAQATDPKHSTGPQHSTGSQAQPIAGATGQARSDSDAFPPGLERSGDQPAVFSAPSLPAPVWLPLAPAIFLLLWSGGYAVAKIGLTHMQPMTMLSLRYGLAILVLAPIFIVMRPGIPKGGWQWWHLCMVGVLIQGLYFGLSYFAFAIGLSAGAVALIVSLQPILVALLAPAMAGEQVGRLRWLGLLLGLAGAALVIGAKSSIEVTSMVGVLCAVGALLSMSLATLYEKRFGVRQHPITANLVQYSIGLAMLFPIALHFETLAFTWSLELGLVMAYLVIGNSLVAITLLLTMIRHGEASRVSALLFLVPPMAALIAWGLIGEIMPPLAWLGMAIAGVGVAIAGRPDSRTRRA